MVVLNVTRQQKFLWLLLLLIVVMLVFAQFRVGARVKARTVDLRHSLDNDYILALELTSVLGYGGLIHHFKNFLLRPEQPQYLEAGIKAATVADELEHSLEKSAGELGFETTLTNTRAAISGYRERLERIPMLVNAGLSTQQMDKALRLDDQFAIQEISNLLEQLSGSVKGQIDHIEVQGQILNLLSLAGTTVLSVLILTMFIQRRHRVAYVKSIYALNQQLAASNSSLTEVNTSLKQFAGIVSHDLKTPLRHISLFNDQILEDIDDRDAVRSHVATVQASVVRMMGLISSLLDFTITGFKQSCRELIDIEPIIVGVVSEYQIRYANLRDVTWRSVAFRILIQETDMANRNTLLLVEDDDIDAMMMKRIVSSLRPDIDLVRAINGQDAIAILQTLRPRIIIMDIRMPLMDGRETLAHLKGLEKFQQIPIVMMTTSENPDDIEFCYQHNANAYMSKGIDSKAIKTDISNLLNFWFETVRILPGVR